MAQVNVAKNNIIANVENILGNHEFGWRKVDEGKYTLILGEGMFSTFMDIQIDFENFNADNFEDFCEHWEELSEYLSSEWSQAEDFDEHKGLIGVQGTLYGQQEENKPAVYACRDFYEKH